MNAFLVQLFDVFHDRETFSAEFYVQTGHLCITMKQMIAANTTVTVYVPAKDEAGVTESGKPASEFNGVKFLRMENNAAVYTAGSGTYRFQIEPDK